MRPAKAVASPCVRFARTRHSLRYSHTKNIKVDECSVKLRDMYPYCTAAHGRLKTRTKDSLGNAIFIRVGIFHFFR